MSQSQAATNIARTDRWRCALLDAVDPCPKCGQLVLWMSQGSPWDLSGHDAGIVAGLRGLDPADRSLGSGISRAHPCQMSRPPPFDGVGVDNDELDAASRWEAHVNQWAVSVVKRARARRGLDTDLTQGELDAVLPRVTPWN